MAMSIRIRIDPDLLVREFGLPVRDKVAEAKVEQLERESYRHFRDDTGALRKTIRLERGGIVAIGDSRHPYWQNLRLLKRGDGVQWVRQVLRSRNNEALARARNLVRR